ncbi:hypothetical protein V0288_15790 [Pannus brasiliensis CCIBt3594]|uniref:Uncharacterized protein n=1 Tax=Pannus brasiliensis CCIBt3594 TaxID=1427578 RepID=A0AAW9QZB3_9CHRO
MLDFTKRGRAREVTLLTLLLSASIVTISLSYLPVLARQSLEIQSATRSTPSFIPAGTAIPVRYDRAEKILLTPEETYSLSLTVTESIKNALGKVIIPDGSQIIGEIKPSERGSRFFSQKIFLKEERPRSEPIDAISDAVNHLQKIIKGANPDRVIKGAALGESAAALLASLTDDRPIDRSLLRNGRWEVLAGWLLRGESLELVSIEPRRDLTLTLRSDFDRK